jgi:hypothetical protein
LFGSRFHALIRRGGWLLPTAPSALTDYEPTPIENEIDRVDILYGFGIKTTKSSNPTEPPHGKPNLCSLLAGSSIH